MTFEETLASIDASLKSLVTIMSSAAAAPGLVGAAAPPAAAKPVHYHLVDAKQVLKTTTDQDKPLGAIEITAKEFKDLEKKYADAKN